MVSLSNHVAISLRLNTRRQTTIATATRLPRCARNDRLKWVRVSSVSQGKRNIIDTYQIESVNDVFRNDYFLGASGVYDEIDNEAGVASAQDVQANDWFKVLVDDAIVYQSVSFTGRIRRGLRTCAE